MTFPLFDPRQPEAFYKSCNDRAVRVGDQPANSFSRKAWISFSHAAAECLGRPPIAEQCMGRSKQPDRRGVGVHLAAQLEHQVVTALDESDRASRPPIV